MYHLIHIYANLRDIGFFSCKYAHMINNSSKVDPIVKTNLGRI